MNFCERWMKFGGPVILVWGVVALVPVDSVRGQCSDWSTPVNLSNIPGRFSVDPGFDFDASGNVHLAFQDFLDASGRIYYTTNASGSWATPTLLATTSGKTGLVRVIVTPDQVIHVFWSKGEVYEHAKAVSGGSWSGPVRVSENPSNGFIGGVAMDSSGGIQLVWTNLFEGSGCSRNAIWTRYKPLGGSFGATSQIDCDSYDGNWPGGAWVTYNSEDNKFYITWEHNGIKWRSASPGGAWGGTNSYPGGGGGLRLAWDPTSNEMVGAVGRDVDGDQYQQWFEIFVRYSDNGGASWSSEYNVSDQVGLDRMVEIAYDANGNLHTVWQGFQNGPAHVHYKGRIGGAWGSRVDLTPGSQRAGAPPSAIQTLGNEVWLAYAHDTNYEEVYVTHHEPIGPRTNVSRDTISRSMWIRNTLTNDTFTVGNGCAGTMNYTISDNASWLNVAPASGSAVLDVDTITVSYPGAYDLQAGTHNATITVSGDAPGPALTIDVTVTVSTVAPDFDGDADVDQDDFAHIQECLTGTGVAVTDTDCLDARLDWDGTYNGDKDVDAADLDLFFGCVSGANVIANPGCMP